MSLQKEIEELLLLQQIGDSIIKLIDIKKNNIELKTSKLLDVNNSIVDYTDDFREFFNLKPPFQKYLAKRFNLK